MLAPIPAPVVCRIPNAECHSLHVLSKAHPPQAASVSQTPVVMSDHALTAGGFVEVGKPATTGLIAVAIVYHV